MSNLQVRATVIGSHLKKEPTASPVLTKWWKLELTLATNFGSHAQMVTKFGGQILATKFGFVPDCWMWFHFIKECMYALSHQHTTKEADQHVKILTYFLIMADILFRKLVPGFHASWCLLKIYQKPNSRLDLKTNWICRRHAKVWSHPSHYTVHPPTPPWLPIGHSHGHQLSTHIPFVPCQSAPSFLK